MQDEIEGRGSYGLDDVQTEEDGLLSSLSGKLRGAAVGVTALATLGLGACAGNPAPAEGPSAEEEVQELQRVRIEGPSSQGAYDVEVEFEFRSEDPVTMSDILYNMPPQPGCQKAEVELDFGSGARGTRYGDEIDHGTWYDRDCDGNVDGNGQDRIRTRDPYEDVSWKVANDFELAQAHLLTELQAGNFGSGSQNELYVNGDRIDPEGEELDPEDIGFN